MRCRTRTTCRNLKTELRRFRPRQLHSRMLPQRLGPVDPQANLVGPFTATPDKSATFRTVAHQLRLAHR